MTIYNYFIVSNFNYCPLAWHFCSTSSTNKLENIQERALCFMNNDFTSSLQALLTSTNTAPLHVRRMKQMASKLYKFSPDYIKDLITIKQSNYNFRRENQASLSAVKSTRYGLRPFRYEAAWNSLPNDLTLAESFSQFKRLLHAWGGDFMLNLGFALLCFCSSVLTPLHSLCLQAFAFRSPFFRFLSLSLCCKGCVSLGVYLLQP